MAHAAEHLEHAEHNAHIMGGFEMKVAVTMAIIAAILAALHSIETKFHGDSLTYAIQSGTKSTEASNKWSYFQAKNNRGHQDKVISKLLDTLPKSNEEAHKALKKELSEESSKYDDEKEEIKAEAEKLSKEAEELSHKSHHLHEVSNRVGYATLALELGLVISSLAVLTKKKFFWVLGAILGAIGTIFGLYLFLVESGLLKLGGIH